MIAMPNVLFLLGLDVAIETKRLSASLHAPARVSLSKRLTRIGGIADWSQVEYAKIRDQCNLLLGLNPGAKFDSNSLCAGRG